MDGFCEWSYDQNLSGGISVELQIYHTVNAGLYLWNGRSGLLVDALHGGKRAGFSDVPDRYIQMMRKREQFFGQVNDLLYTHTHEDHYDEELVDEFLSLNPESLIYGPEPERNTILPDVSDQGKSRLQIRDYTVYAFATEHAGETARICRHVSYLILSGEQAVWVSGDASLEPSLAEQAGRICGETRINAAFVMVYQLGSRKGTDFLKKLDPERIYLYHLPYREDDSFHYYRMAEQTVEKCRRQGIPVRILELDSFADYREEL